MSDNVSFFLKRGVLLNPDVLEKINEDFFSLFENIFNGKNKPVVITKDVHDLVIRGDLDFNVNWTDFERARVFHEKGKDVTAYSTFLKLLNYEKNKEKLSKILTDIKKPDKFEQNTSEESFSKPIIIKQYSDKKDKVNISSFVSYYRTRYDYLSKILQSRASLANSVSINRLNYKHNGDKVSVIGLVFSKTYTKNNHIMLEIEDLTGITKAIVMNTKKELYTLSNDTVPDEVIGIKGVFKDGLIFIDELYFPDIPHDEFTKKGNKEEYVAFISDIHIGSTVFLEDNFLRFINWINGDYGNSQQKEVGKKVKYLVIVGDVVDGIGIYPGQDETLKIKDISGQYDKCAELLSLIRKDVNIIICPGNHDAVRLAEPQPVFDKKISSKLWDMDNVSLVTNPSIINIGATSTFEGFHILMYHGYSFDYYIDYLDNVRAAGGYDSIDLLLKLLLQKRHLAPTHISTPTMIDSKEDHHLIEDVPDVFVTGHIHKAKIGQYGKVTLISSSCWQDKTDFQEKLGHTPEPCRVPIINLKNRKAKIMKFI